MFKITRRALTLALAVALCAGVLAGCEKKYNADAWANTTAPIVATPSTAPISTPTAPVSTPAATAEPTPTPYIPLKFTDDMHVAVRDGEMGVVKDDGTVVIDFQYGIAPTVGSQGTGTDTVFQGGYWKVWSGY